MRVIGAEGEQVGILTRDEALAMAQEVGMDLVEIQPNGDPPVCRIMDFGKFKFDAQKKAHAAKKKQKQVKITIRFRGREMAHQELGRAMVDKISADIIEEAVIEQYPRMEGRLMVMMIAPKKK